MESITLLTPEVTAPKTTTDYKVMLLLLDFEGGQIVAQLRGTNGEKREFRYEGSDALALLTALNKANLTTQSLQKRILLRLIADNKISGNVTGTPD